MFLVFDSIHQKNNPKIIDTLSPKINTIRDIVFNTDFTSSKLSFVLSLLPFFGKRIHEGRKFQLLRKPDHLRFFVTKEIGFGIISVRNYEPEVCRFFEQIKGEIFIDIGAGVGAYSLNFCNNFKHVIAFEPGEISFELLLRNIEANSIKNVEIFQVAISEKPGKIGLDKSGNPVNWSIVSPTVESEEVESAQLDDILSKYEFVDLIKIDVEGAELSVIKSAKKSLSKLKNIIIEVRDIYEVELRSILTENGFHARVLENRETIREKNILFTRT